MARSKAEQPIAKFAELPQVTAVLEPVQPIAQCFSAATRSSRHIHFMTVKISSKQKAEVVRKRIIEDHKGVESPPCTVIYGPAVNI